MNTIHTPQGRWLLFSHPTLEWLLYSDRALYVHNTLECTYDFVHFADEEEVLQLQHESAELWWAHYADDEEIQQLQHEAELCSA